MSTLIGFKDEEIIDIVDWSCNKFGGLPVCIFFDKIFLKLN